MRVQMLLDTLERAPPQAPDRGVERIGHAGEAGERGADVLRSLLERLLGDEREAHVRETRDRADEAERVLEEERRDEDAVVHRSSGWKAVRRGRTRSAAEVSDDAPDLGEFLRTFGASS